LTFLSSKQLENVQGGGETTAVVNATIEVSNAAGELAGGSYSVKVRDARTKKGSNNDSGC